MYFLYLFVITDGMGVARVVMYAYLVEESIQSLTTLCTMFKTIMGHEASSRIRTFVMDKMPAQLSAFGSSFNADICLCYFHVRQAIRRGWR